MELTRTTKVVLFDLDNTPLTITIAYGPRILPTGYRGCLECGIERHPVFTHIAGVPAPSIWEDVPVIRHIGQLLEHLGTTKP